MRRNAVGQPMITAELHAQLWDFEQQPNPLLVRQAKAMLKHQGIPEEAPIPKTVYQVTPQLPAPLLPRDDLTVLERLEIAIGNHVEPTKRRAQALIESNVSRFDASRLALEAGWTRYEHGRDYYDCVAYPEEDVVLDTETMVKFGNWPVMAAAVSATAWYIWLHPSLTGSLPTPFYGT